MLERRRKVVCFLRVTVSSRRQHLARHMLFEPAGVTKMAIEKKSFSGTKGTKKVAAAKRLPGGKLSAPKGQKLANLKGSQFSEFHITKPIDVSSPSL